MFTAIIVSAGSGKRMNIGYNKVFYEIKGLTLIEYSVNAFIKNIQCREVILVARNEDFEKMSKIFGHYAKIKIIEGGKTRQESVFNGIKECHGEYVMIHDGARPNITSDQVTDIYNVLLKNKAVILCHKAKDSILLEDKKFVFEYLDRSTVCLVETPQAFRTDLIRKAYEKALANNHTYYDDASLYMGELNRKVKLFYNDRNNLKATTKEDLAILEKLL